MKAKDWLNLALNAPDAASQPALCAVCRYYLALCNGQKADLTELNNAAAGGSSWACLLLGDLARDEDQKLRYYIQGAKADPATETIASRAADCAERRDAIYRRRAAAHNEAIRLRKQAQDEEARRAEEARLTQAQNSWLTVFGVGYAVTIVAYVVLSILAGSTGNGFFLTLGGLAGSHLDGGRRPDAGRHIWGILPRGLPRPPEQAARHPGAGPGPDPAGAHGTGYPAVTVSCPLGRNVCLC